MRVSEVETLLRFATTSLRSADDRITAIQTSTKLDGQKHAAKLKATHRHIAEAVESVTGWAKANGVEIRESMNT